MRRTKMISLIVLAFLLPFMATPVTTVYAAAGYAQTPVARIAGPDRYQTAVAVSQEGWTESPYALLASGGNFPDAIAVAPLAMKYEAPILLTAKDTLPLETRNELQRLGTREVMIIGGTGAVTAKVEAQIKALGMEVTRIAGGDRYETAVKIAEKLGHVQEAMLATGENFPDALSVAPAAAKKGIPILLVKPDLIPDGVKKYLSGTSITKVYTVGDSSIFPEKTLKELPCAYESIYGYDRYTANQASITKFQDILNSGVFFAATGKDFADALTGSVLAAKRGAPLLFMEDQPWQTANFIYYKNEGVWEPSSYTTPVILGGTKAVSSDAENILKYYRQIIPEAYHQVIFGPFGFSYPGIGQVMIAGDWAYYNRIAASPWGEVSYFGENAVYKMKLDGSENSRVFFTGPDIYNYTVAYIVNHAQDFSIRNTITMTKIENGFLYYQLSEDNTIYKVSAEGSQDNLPAVIRSVQMTDDSQPALTWTPIDQTAVSSRILAWLQASVPYTMSNTEIKPWDKPENQVTDNDSAVRCARLILTVTDKSNKITQNVTLYPRYYKELSGRNTIIKFVPGVIAVKNGQSVAYCRSPELADWLLENQWKSEFHLP